MHEQPASFGLHPARERDPGLEGAGIERAVVGRRQVQEGDAVLGETPRVVAIFAPQIDDRADPEPVGEVRDPLVRHPPADGEIRQQPGEVRDPFARLGLGAACLLSHVIVTP